MTPMSFDEMRSVQINILQVIHDFCEKHGIRYSMACGTLLGAVRHKGYIPWDDDIDIYLLREDYEKLISQFPEQLNNIKIASLSRDPSWEYAYAKAYDERTFVKETAVVNKPIGVNIDVYPIDRVPEDKSQWKRYNLKRKIIHKAYYVKFLKFDKERPLLKNLFHIATKLLLFPVSLRKLAEIINKYSQKYNNTESPLVFESIQGWRVKNPFLRQSMQEVIDMPFENSVFKGMQGYDDYLKAAYGKYMELPPVEKRVNHHTFVPYWKK